MLLTPFEIDMSLFISTQAIVLGHSRTLPYHTELTAVQAMLRITVRVVPALNLGQDIGCLDSRHIS